jgi:hypothetical protein
LNRITSVPVALTSVWSPVTVAILLSSLKLTLARSVVSEEMGNDAQSSSSWALLRVFPFWFVPV